MFIRSIVVVVLSIFVRAAQSQPTSAEDLGPAPLLRPAAGSLPDGYFTGRLSAIACSPTDPEKYFVGGPGSGVWRREAPPTAPNDYTWTPLTDDMPTLAIGALAIDPNDEDIIYAGTGDPNFAHHSPYGLGLYKSTDGGDTWSHLAESTFAGRAISRIVIDPTPVEGASPTLYAAVVRAGGFPEASAAKLHPDPWDDVGVFKSTNGGSSWTHLTNGLHALSATDLVIDPTDPDILYAATGHIFGNSNNGVYRTTDGGANWTKISSSPFPSSDVGRIGIAIAPADPETLYALLAEASGSSGSGGSNGGWRTTNARDASPTWESYGSVGMAEQGFFDLCVTVDPDDESIVYYGGITALRWVSSTSSQFIATLHGDCHAWAWDADGRLLSGNDGGLERE